jgi:hypothetical protein
MATARVRVGQEPLLGFGHPACDRIHSIGLEPLDAGFETCARDGFVYEASVAQIVSVVEESTCKCRFCSCACAGHFASAARFSSDSKRVYSPVGISRRSQSDTMQPAKVAKMQAGLPSKQTRKAKVQNYEREWCSFVSLCSGAYGKVRFCLCKV